MGRIVDGEVQRVDLRAAIIVEVGVGVEACGCVGGAAACIPSICLTSHLCDGCMDRIVDGEVQRVDLRAVVGVGMTIGIDTANAISRALPGVGLASRVGYGSVDRVVDGEVECVDLHTVVGVEMRIDIVSTGVVILPLPIKGVADRFGYSSVDGMVDGDVVCHDAVATGEGGEGIEQNGIVIERHTTPGITVAYSDAVVACGRSACDIFKHRIAAVNASRVGGPTTEAAIGVMGIHPGVESIEQVGYEPTANKRGCVESPCGVATREAGIVSDNTVFTCHREVSVIGLIIAIGHIVRSTARARDDT